MISVRDLYKSFNGAAVLKGISFEVNKGEVVALIGSSGQGKSVLLRHVAGLMKPDCGSVAVDGADICCLSGRKLTAIRSRFGFLFQGGALFGSLTVFENVAFPLREKTRLTTAEIRDKVLNQLEEVGLADAHSKYPAEISGGMVKRAALARALVRVPEIMCFDEPTTGLDPIIAHAILDLIKSCHLRRKFTGLLVTHQIPAAFDVVDKVVFLHEGRVQMVGKPKDLFASTDPVVAHFIRGSTLMTIYRSGLLTEPGSLDHLVPADAECPERQQEGE